MTELARVLDDPHGLTCHEDVTRKGHRVPCDRPAVAVIDSDGPYPVCHPHGAGRLLVPLQELLATAWEQGYARCIVTYGVRTEGMTHAPNPYDRKEPS